MIKVFDLSNFGFQLVLISALYICVCVCVCVYFTVRIYIIRKIQLFSFPSENEKILFLLGYISLHTVLSNFYLQDSWFCTKSNTLLMQSFNTVFDFFFSLCKYWILLWILRIKYCFVPLFEMIIWDMA